MDGKLGGYLRGQINKIGVVVMEKIWDNGFRQITTSTHPIAQPFRSPRHEDPGSCQRALDIVVPFSRRGPHQSELLGGVFRA
jgi:hypothetical protein